jgi:hypothetical protein
MALCIPKDINKKLKEALAENKLTAKGLIDASPSERIDRLNRIVGDGYGDEVNSQISRKLNLELSDDTIKDIQASYKTIDALKEADTAPWKPGEAKQWAREYVALNNRVNADLNPRSGLGLIKGIKASAKEEARKIADQPGIIGKGVQTVKSVTHALTSPIYKSVKASVDASYSLRQGFKVFTKSPKQWYKSIGESFSVFKKIGSKQKMDIAMDEFRAIYLSNPHYEQLVNQGGLAFGVVEEFFPTTVVQKVPVLGNLFKASDEAFTTFSQGARFGIAEDLLEKQTKILGRDLTKKELESIAYIANSITGRGHLGKLEPISGAINKVFFSGRFIKSSLDTFTMPFNSNLTPFARKEAFKHSVATFGSVAALAATASFFTDVETDPVSTNFMRMRAGDRWIDLSAGLGSYITLAARTATKTSRTMSGRKSTLNTGKYGSLTAQDIWVQWASNKLSPAFGTLNQAVLLGETFEGKKPTTLWAMENTLFPISPSNWYDYFSNESMVTAIMLSVLDALGTNISQKVK